MRHDTLPLLLLALLVLAAGPAGVAAQGLRADEAPARSSGTFAKFSEYYKQSVAWRNAMGVSTTSACSRKAGSLCGGSLNAAQQAALEVAAAPQAWDSRDAFGRSGAQVVGPVKEQGSCGACVAFAVLAAAQTAAAMALRTSFRSTLSEHDFCKSVQPGFVRNCDAGLTMLEGVKAWLDLHRAGRLPVSASCLRYDPGIGGCKPSCTTTLPELLQGAYQAVPLSSIVNMQRHVRQYGSIMCRMQVHSDLRPFYESDRLGVYRGPAQGAAYELSHAVQVVGYDNSKQAWLVKNSWGDGWASEGFGWVSFNAPGMCDPDYTYGFTFTPKQPLAASKPQLVVVPGRPGCYSYQALPGDYPHALAVQFGVKLQQLLLDNLAVAQDPSTLPPGSALMLCGVSPAALAGATVTRRGPGRAVAAPLPAPAPKPKVNPPVVAVKPSPMPILEQVSRPVVYPVPQVRRAPPVVLPQGPTALPTKSSSSPADEVAALLAIKRVLDPPGTVLRDWQPGSSTACGWLGVVCDHNRGKVAGIRFPDPRNDFAELKLTGQLPGIQLLRRLPSLVEINLSNTSGIHGSLPQDWSLLRQVERIGLWSNALTGTLPPSWGTLTRLQVLALSHNKLHGPLPGAWSNMAALRQLRLNGNDFVGTVPASWGRWNMTSSTAISLCKNPKLTGCLPRNWEHQLVPQLGGLCDKPTVVETVFFEKEARIGTKISGYC